MTAEVEEIAEAVTHYHRYSRDHNIDKASQLRDEVLQ
jgi:hypothetical protein